MVTPETARRVVIDAARLVREGELVVFGSAALAFWLDAAPTSRDVDLWVTPAERGDVVEALMGELSWYHDLHGAYVEVLGPETFRAPRSWRERARVLSLPELPKLRVLVAHPHDVLCAKLERFEQQDRDRARRILAELPLDAAELEGLAAETPYRLGQVEDPSSVAAFEIHVRELRRSLEARA